MLRTIESVVSLRNFGGLNDTFPRRAIQPNEFSDLNNVVVSENSVRVRPPWLTYASGLALGFSASDGRLLEAQVFRVNDNTAAVRILLAVLRQIISTATARWYIVDITSTPTLLGSSQDSFLNESDGHPSQVCQYGDVIYCNYNAGRGTKFYFDSTNTFRSEDIGIDKPVTPVVIGSSAAGTLPVGDYSWRYTYYNSDTGAESGPSPAVTHTVTGAADDEFTFVLVPATDPQITNMRIYRLLEGTDDTWYYLDDAPASGTFYSDDGSLSPDKTVAGRMPIAERIPVGNGVATYKGRMWTIVNASGDVVYSEYGKPESAVDPLNRLEISEGEPLIRLQVALGGLLCFSQTGIWIIAGDDPDSFTVTKLLEVGCRAPHSVTVVNENVYWGNEWGAHRFGVGGYRVLSEPVRVGWARFSKPELMGSAYDRVRNLLMFHQEDSDGSRTMVYDMRGEGRQLDVWYRWHGSSSIIKGVAAVELGRSRPLLLALRSNTDLVYMSDSYGGTDFGSNAISWAIETGDMDFGTSWKKRLNYWRVRRNRAPSGTDTISTQFSYDGGSLESGTSSNFFGTPPSADLFVGRGDWETVRCRVSGSANVETAIVGMDFDLTPEGHR